MLVVICSYLFYNKSKHFAKLSINTITDVYFVTYTYEKTKTTKKHRILGGGCYKKIKYASYTTISFIYF